MKEIERTHYELGRLFEHLQTCAGVISSIHETICNDKNGKLVGTSIEINLVFDFHVETKDILCWKGEEHQFYNGI